MDYSISDWGTVYAYQAVDATSSGAGNYITSNGHVESMHFGDNDYGNTHNSQLARFWNGAWINPYSMSLNAGIW